MRKCAEHDAGHCIGNALRSLNWWRSSGQLGQPTALDANPIAIWKPPNSVGHCCSLASAHHAGNWRLRHDGRAQRSRAGARMSWQRAGPTGLRAAAGPRAPPLCGGWAGSLCDRGAMHVALRATQRPAAHCWAPTASGGGSSGRRRSTACSHSWLQFHLPAGLMPTELLTPFTASCTLPCSPTLLPQLLPQVAYICGDCGAENTLKPGDVIRCRECGYRILYKKRTKRVVQYEAR